jgi:hypothetical protein
METPSHPPRRVRTIAEASDLVAAWKGSGLNKEAWCRSQGILRSALQSCLHRVDGQVRAPVRFIEVRPAAGAAQSPAASPPALTLELGYGLRVVGLDVSGLLQLVQALRVGRA